MRCVEQESQRDNFIIPQVVALFKRVVATSTIADKGKAEMVKQLADSWRASASGGGLRARASACGCAAAGDLRRVLRRWRRRRPAGDDKLMRSSWEITATKQYEAKWEEDGPWPGSKFKDV